MAKATKSILTLSAFVGLASAYAFPDCTTAPLKGNAVCDTSKDPITRASALVSLFTVAELINNTDNGSPGVPRLGLPAYQWWSEALVSSPFPFQKFLLIYFLLSLAWRSVKSRCHLCPLWQLLLRNFLPTAYPHERRVP